jgi:hypothetical protein
MYKLLSEVIKRVPQWLLLLAIVFLIAWFGGLSYVAFFSHRSVEFFPPKVGPDKRLLATIENMNATLQTLRDKNAERIKFLQQELAKSRYEAATSDYSFSKGYEFHQNEAKYEREINEADKNMNAKLDDLSARVSTLEVLLR